MRLGCRPVRPAHTIALALAGLLGLFLASGFFLRPAASQTSGPDAAPPKVGELLDLLQDPELRHWLEQRKAAEGREGSPGAQAQSGQTISALLDARAAAIRAHLSALVAA